MRVLGFLVLVLWLPGRVLAAPEPPPPGDFPGAQYIDRSGCVFLRDGADWRPRLDRDGAPVCGFPPSQPAEASLPDDRPPSPEEALAAVLAEGLRAGDLDAAEPAFDGDPLAGLSPATVQAGGGIDAAQVELDATLARQIELEERLRSIMAGKAPEGLCARLGYRITTDAPPIIGGDVTDGFCPGMTAPGAGPAGATADAAAIPAQPAIAAPAATAAVRASAKSAAAGSPAGAAASGAPRRAAAKPPRHDAQAARGSGTGKPPAVDTSAPAVPPEMIPASARYVQVGLFADEAAALAALRRLAAMGYPTAQRIEPRAAGSVKAILAGPFADRQALVTALTRLRGNGYAQAVAR